MHVSPHPNPELHVAAPAWAEDGRIVLGPAAFLLPPEERESLVRHETIHALLPIEFAELGTEVAVETPDERTSATVVRKPFIDPQKEIPKQHRAAAAKDD